MLVSLKWLKDYVDVPWSPKALAERLTMTGAKVEGIRQIAKELAGVVVGQVAEAAPHPYEASLRVCQVDIGGRRVQSVCGAPNVAQGMLVPVALPGAVLPGIGKAVAESEVRGVCSAAVLCSEKELGISDDHSGVMALPSGLVPGHALVEALGLDDAIIEFEIYPNRPDCLSVVGIAREVAAAAGTAIRMPEIAVRESKPHVSTLASVTVLDPDLCPRYIARVIEGVRVGPSPAWMQERLRAAGMRPINNVVDVTNFVMLELGQPLHAFDRSRLAESRIVVRRAKEGERMRTLDGVERVFTSDDLLICDARQPVAVAGVMGGEDSEVSPDTTSVLLESATFDPVSVRRTSRRLGLRTEASHRFEKGLHPRLAEIAVDRAARLLAELASGVVAEGRIDVAAPFPEPNRLSVAPQRVNAYLGTQLSPAEMKRILRSLEFEVELDAGAERIDIKVPWFRRDVTREADVIEEIARMYGYDRIEATLPSGANVQGRLAGPLRVVESVRDAMVAAGLFESLTYSFISPRWYDWLGLPQDHALRRAIPLQNPLSEEQSVMRTTLMPSLLAAVGLNERRQVTDIRLFEVGKVYLPQELPLKALPDERWSLGIVLAGTGLDVVWGERHRQVDFFDLKGVLETLAEALGLRFTYERAEHPALHPGRTARVSCGGESVGVFGEVHPRVAETFDLRGRVYIAELDLEALVRLERPAIRFEPLPRYPGVQRDLALLVPKDVPVGAVEEMIRGQGGAMLRSLELFDVYEGSQVPAGMRSVAFKLLFQSAERTLTDDEINAVQGEIARRLKEGLGVEVRG